MTRKQSVYTLTSIYVGTVIGAGFASGQEIFQFFARYGYKGIIGSLVTTILFSLLGALILNIIYMRKIRDFKGFTRLYFGKNFSNYIDKIIIFLLFIIYVVMLSGSGAVAKENFNIPPIYGICIMGAVTLYVFIFGLDGLARANNIVVPILIGVMLLVSLVTIYKNKMIFSNFYTYGPEDIGLINYNEILGYSVINKIGWLWSALIYVSFNSMSIVVLMSSLGGLIKDRESAILAGVLGGLILGILVLVILINLLILHTDIIGIEVPMLAIANNLGGKWKQIYSIILLIAMFTTAIGNGYGCILGIHNLSKINPRLISVIICIISIPLATFGFAKLVTLFYPLFGYIGAVFILAILFKNKGF